MKQLSDRHLASEERSQNLFAFCLALILALAFAVLIHTGVI